MPGDIQPESQGFDLWQYLGSGKLGEDLYSWWNNFTGGIGGAWNAISGKGTMTEQEYNSAEAQKARDFELMMSSTAYQRGLADMKAAGINPAATGGMQPASVPSGHSASSGGSASGGFAGLIGRIATIAICKGLASKFGNAASGASTAAGTVRQVSQEATSARAAFTKSHLMDRVFENARDGQWPYNFLVEREGMFH